MSHVSSSRMRSATQNTYWPHRPASCIGGSRKTINHALPKYRCWRERREQTLAKPLSWWHLTVVCDPSRSGQYLFWVVDFILGKYQIMLNDNKLPVSVVWIFPVIYPYINLTKVCFQINKIGYRLGRLKPHSPIQSIHLLALRSHSV